MTIYGNFSAYFKCYSNSKSQMMRSVHKKGKLYASSNKYKYTFYITCAGSDGGCLEVEPNKCLREMASMGDASPYFVENRDQLATAWEPLITSARKWLKVVRKDWIKANKRVQAEYPLRHRYAVVPNALIRTSLPDIYRLNKELGKSRTWKLVRLIEDGFFLRAKNTEVSSMTAADYFKYCRIAYLAGKHKEETVDESLSGREMYARYADDRHEGLMDIDPASERNRASSTTLSFVDVIEFPLY